MRCVCFVALTVCTLHDIALEKKSIYVIDYTRIIDFVNGYVVFDLTKLYRAVIERS